MRNIPAVNKILEHAAVAPYESLVGRAALREAIDEELVRLRAAQKIEPLELIVDRVVERIEHHATRELREVINGTGTLLHTNLGRAPIGETAFAHAWHASRSYSNLEFDLEAGERGSRYERATAVLRELTGAEDAVVVNNCAAAILLILDTFARGAEVIVARNQLIEIGGGFRLPDVLERSGAKLVEVGATNKVYVHDYQGALSPRSALLMRSHRSNFSIEGFVKEVSGEDLVKLGARVGIPVVEDLGSGALVDLSEYGLPRERTVQDAVRENMGLIAFSGDKLLGGPQAGVIVGKRALVARLRSNPLIRALRPDKVTIALLVGTLRAYRSAETRSEIPFYRMLGATEVELRTRASLYVVALANAEITCTYSFVGGGSLPHASLKSVGVALKTARPDDLSRRLREWRTPIIARVDEGQVVLDLRTIAPSEDREVLAALTALAE